MRRLVLHLLLILSLILNGVSAPWAMAGMSHGDHAMSERAEPASPDAAVDSHAHHAHAAAVPSAAGASDGAPTQDAPDSPLSSHERACCNAGSCACGCVLPPALGHVVRASIAPEHDSVAFVVPAAHAVPGHDSPPFRPPAA